MVFRIDLTERAADDVARVLHWYVAEAPDPSVNRAAEWRRGLREALDSLKQMPRRCPLAPEGRDLGLDIRQLLVGQQPNIYRILFVVEEERVLVLRICHAALQRLESGELLGG